MPHLHLSLQSGDDMILKRMKRRHLRDDSIRFCEDVRRLRPDIVFGADIIAGFPTETEAMFENSLEIVEECGLTHLHVFPFSPARGNAGRAHAAAAGARSSRSARRGCAPPARRPIARHLDVAGRHRGSRSWSSATGSAAPKALRWPRSAPARRARSSTATITGHDGERLIAAPARRARGLRPHGAWRWVSSRRCFPSASKEVEARPAETRRCRRSTSARSSADARPRPSRAPPRTVRSRCRSRRRAAGNGAGPARRSAGALPSRSSAGAARSRRRPRKCRRRSRSGRSPTNRRAGTARGAGRACRTPEPAPLEVPPLPSRSSRSPAQPNFRRRAAVAAGDAPSARRQGHRRQEGRAEGGRAERPRSPRRGSTGSSGCATGLSRSSQRTVRQHRRRLHQAQARRGRRCRIWRTC